MFTVNGFTPHSRLFFSSGSLCSYSLAHVALEGLDQPGGGDASCEQLQQQCDVVGRGGDNEIGGGSGDNVGGTGGGVMLWIVVMVVIFVAAKVSIYINIIYIYIYVYICIYMYIYIHIYSPPSHWQHY